MRRRFRLALIALLLCAAAPASAQLSIGIGLPSVSIGINLSSYPQLTPVPGYPVYYAPGVASNYFFYDGMYWVYQDDNWYASSWYNGPWGIVAPDVVPVFVLRVPVRYYRQPPAYFRGWQRDRPPRWGEHWGRDWEQRRPGWSQRNHASVPARAPLPSYQGQYRGDRYPRVEQQPALHGEHYRYQPREGVVREHYQAQGVQIAPAAARRPSSAPPSRESHEARREPSRASDRDRGDDRRGDDRKGDDRKGDDRRGDDRNRK